MHWPQVMLAAICLTHVGPRGCEGPLCKLGALAEIGPASGMLCRRNGDACEVVLPLRVLGVAAAVICLAVLGFVVGGPGRDSDSALRGFASGAIPTRQQLGRSSWTLLHRMAAQYPAEPSRQQEQDMQAFIHSLGQFYPCSECAGHFREMLARSPPTTHSGPALVAWFCHRHNEVNVRLGKTPFSCEPAALKERWGDCGCSDKPDAGA